MVLTNEDLRSKKSKIVDHYSLIIINLLKIKYAVNQIDTI